MNYIMTFVLWVWHKYSGMLDKVDKAVKRSINRGNMSTLNSKEDIQLAEKLLEINKWAGMVKFARSGGEANAIAIRIARAAVKKTKLQFVDIMDGMIGIWLQT